jgi:hypothetical protein
MIRISFQRFFTLSAIFNGPRGKSGKISHISLSGAFLWERSCPVTFAQTILG